MDNYSNNHSDDSNETVYVGIAVGMSLIVGLLILVQLFRAQPMDLPSMLIIAVCFVVAVIGTARWGARLGR